MERFSISYHHSQRLEIKQKRCSSLFRKSCIRTNGHDLVNKRQLPFVPPPPRAAGSHNLHGPCGHSGATNPCRCTNSLVGVTQDGRAAWDHMDHRSGHQNHDAPCEFSGDGLDVKYPFSTIPTNFRVPTSTLMFILVAWFLLYLEQETTGEGSIQPPVSFINKALLAHSHVLFTYTLFGRFGARTAESISGHTDHTACKT